MTLECFGLTFMTSMHNSLADAIAQMDVMTSKEFTPIINQTSSIQPIDEIFRKPQQSNWKKKIEPVCTVNDQWMEQTTENNFEGILTIEIVMAGQMVVPELFVPQMLFYCWLSM